MGYNTQKPLTTLEEIELSSLRNQDQIDDFLNKRYYPNWSGEHELIQCQGCDSVSYRHVERCSEWESGQVDYFAIYPPRVARRRPDWVDQLKKREIGELFDEVYSALQTNSKRLALMGARCLADIALNDIVGDIGGFEKKIKQAVKDGHLSGRDGNVLNAAVDAGNAAAHRNYNPSDNALSQTLDIIEHLFVNLYIMPNAASNIRQTTPPRK